MSGQEQRNFSEAEQLARTAKAKRQRDRRSTQKELKTGQEERRQYHATEAKHDLDRCLDAIRAAAKQGLVTVNHEIGSTLSRYGDESDLLGDRARAAAKKLGQKGFMAESRVATLDPDCYPSQTVDECTWYVGIKLPEV